MKLKWIDASKLDKNMKATVHKTGKLGFTREAAEKLELEGSDSLSIAVNEDDKSDHDLYVRVNLIDEDGAFKVSKAGEYFYINTKAFFDEQRIPYAKENVVYDILKETIDGVELYRFRRRQVSNKKAAPALTEANH